MQHNYAQIVLYGNQNYLLLLWSATASRAPRLACGFAPYFRSTVRNYSLVANFRYKSFAFIKSSEGQFS